MFFQIFFREYTNGIETHNQGTQKSQANSLALPSLARHRLKINEDMIPHPLSSPFQSKHPQAQSSTQKQQKQITEKKNIEEIHKESKYKKECRPQLDVFFFVKKKKIGIQAHT